MPFYVSPEQVMKDKADYARKAITRIRSGVVITCEAGILFVAPNPSRALRKFSEIYDRIAFAAVTADGFERLTDDDSGEYARTVIEGRMADPDGPPVSPRPAVTPNGSRGALPSR